MAGNAATMVVMISAIKALGRHRRVSPGRATRHLGRSVALTVALLFVASACAELERPEGYSPSPDSSLVIGEGQAIAENTDEEAALAVAPVDDFVPSVDGYIPEILIAAEPESMRAERLAAIPIEGPIQDLAVARIADDLVGGLVVGEVNGPVLYLQDEADPQTIDDAGAELLDVGYWGGSPRAFLLVGDNTIDWVQLVSERESSSRERQNHLVLTEGESVVDFSASRDIQAIAIGDQDCGTLRFYGRNGTDLTLPGPIDPECTFPGRPTYGAVALSPDGGAVAYTIVTYRADGNEAATELVVRELIADQPYYRRRIGEDLDRVISLAFDGNRAVYVKETGEQESVILLEVPGEEASISIDATAVRSVSFARNPATTAS